ncbi:hypothetical protein BGW41_003997 [Actinomortierella wolfii]|nr:hypothetical protein BGW41_003997 [Actinomortierella wolfii]
MNAPNTPLPEQTHPRLPSVDMANETQCCSKGDSDAPAATDFRSRIPKVNRKKSIGTLPLIQIGVPSSNSPRRCLACPPRETHRCVEVPCPASQGQAALQKAPPTPTCLVSPVTPHPSLQESSTSHRLSSEGRNNDEHDYSLLDTEQERRRSDKEPKGLDAECTHNVFYRQPSNISNGEQSSTEPDLSAWRPSTLCQQQQHHHQSQQQHTVRAYGNHRYDGSNPLHPEKDHPQQTYQRKQVTKPNSETPHTPHAAHPPYYDSALLPPPPTPPPSATAAAKQPMILLPPLSLDDSPSRASTCTSSPTTLTKPKARMTPLTTTGSTNTTTTTTTTTTLSSLGKGQPSSHNSTVRKQPLSSSASVSTVRRRASLDQSPSGTISSEKSSMSSRIPKRRGSNPLLDSVKTQRFNAPSPEAKASPSRRNSDHSNSTWSTSSLPPVNASDTVRYVQPSRPAIGDTPSIPLHRRRQRQRSQPVQTIFDSVSASTKSDHVETNDDDCDADYEVLDAPSSPKPVVNKELLEQVNKISQDKLDAMDRIMGTKNNTRFTISRKKGQKILAELEKEFGSDLQVSMNDTISQNPAPSIARNDGATSTSQGDVKDHSDESEDEEDEEAAAAEGTKTPTALTNTIMRSAISDDPDATIKFRQNDTVRRRPPTLIMQYAGSESPKEPALQPILNPEQFVTRRFAQWSTVRRLGQRTKKKKTTEPYPPSSSSSSSVVSQSARISPSSSQGSLSSTSTDQESGVIRSLPSDLSSCLAEPAFIPETTQSSQPTSRHVLSILELFENKGGDRSKDSTPSIPTKGKEVASQVNEDKDLGINSPAWKMAAKVLFQSSKSTVVGPSSRKSANTKAIEDEPVQQKTLNAAKQEPTTTATATRGRQGWLTTKKLFQTLTKSSRLKAAKEAMEENEGKQSEAPAIQPSGIESFPPQPPSATIKRFLTTRRKVLSQVLFGPEKVDSSVNPGGGETSAKPVSQRSEVETAADSFVSRSNKERPASACATTTSQSHASVVDTQPGFVSIKSLANIPPPGRRNSLHDLLGRNRANSGALNQSQSSQQRPKSPISAVSLSGSVARRNSVPGLITTTITSPNRQEHPSHPHLRVATTNSALSTGPPSSTSSASATGPTHKLGSLYQRAEPQSASTTSSRSSNETLATRRSCSSGASTPVQSNSRPASPIQKLVTLFSLDKSAFTGSAAVVNAAPKGYYTPSSISAPNSPALNKRERLCLVNCESAVSAALPPVPMICNVTGCIGAEAVTPLQQSRVASHRLWTSNSSGDMFSRYANNIGNTSNNGSNSRRNSSYITSASRIPSELSTASIRRYSMNMEPWQARLDMTDDHAEFRGQHNTGLNLVTERHDFLMGDNAFAVPGSTTRTIQDLQEEAHGVLRHGGLHLELPPPASVFADGYDDCSKQQPHQKQQQSSEAQHPTQKRSVFSLKLAQQELFQPLHASKNSASQKPSHSTQQGDAASGYHQERNESSVYNKTLQLELPSDPWLLLATTPERMDHDHGMYRFGGGDSQRRRHRISQQYQQSPQHRPHKQGADSSNSEADDAEEGVSMRDDDEEEEDDGTIGSSLEDAYNRFTPGLSSVAKPMYYDASWDRIKHGHNGGR